VVFTFIAAITLALMAYAWVEGMVAHAALSPNPWRQVSYDVYALDDPLTGNVCYRQRIDTALSCVAKP
jgi:hypothetical protein